MTQFKTGVSGNPKGRPVGSKNKRVNPVDTLTGQAYKKLKQAVDNGEQWAILAVIDRDIAL